MTRVYTVAVLPGDGIGPEVVNATVQILRGLAQLEAIEIEFNYGLIGSAAYETSGTYFPESTAALCAASDGILLGAVATGGLLELRQRFDFFCNLRPVRVAETLIPRSSLRPDCVAGVDLLFVRELVSGIYFGESGRGHDAKGAFGFHTMTYYDDEIRRIARVALAQAADRRGHLTVAHKENALPHLPWTPIVEQEAVHFPTVQVSPMLVDNLAMQLVRQPTQFDVILAGNLFGDLLSDIGGALAGSIGLLASASLNSQGLGLYEPIHGTAPDIAGQGIANPLGTIGAAELMLRQWGLDAAADRLGQAQAQAIQQGGRTADLWRPGDRVPLGTAAIATVILSCLQDQYTCPIV